MKKANPLKSEGARLERKAVRTYLRQRIRHWDRLDAYGGPVGRVMLQEALDWILARQKRYDARPSGLGKRG